MIFVRGEVMSPVIEPFRKQLENEFGGKNVEGLDVERVEGFIKEQGLPVKPYIILRREDLPSLNEVIDSFGGLSGILRSAFTRDADIGTYNPELDMVFLLRNESFEKFNGTIFTEGNLVRVLAHASSMYRDFVFKKNQDEDQYKGARYTFYTPRIGFVLPFNEVQWGWFFENGWAEMLRAEYVSTTRRKLTGPFYWDRVDEGEQLFIGGKYGITSLPAKYFYYVGKGTMTFFPEAFAGYGIELICQRFPKIRDLMVEARKDVKALRELAKAINGIRPGLYTELQRTPKSYEGYERGLRLIQDALL